MLLEVSVLHYLLHAWDKSPWNEICALWMIEDVLSRD